MSFNSPADFWGGGFADHKAWGLVLFALVVFGPGKWSVDGLASRLMRRPQH